METSSSTAIRFTPDLQFVRDLRGAGADTFKQCLQCATCTAVCHVTPADHPFPRKEMLWAQWGLRDRLLADPDAWICHGCGDCSVYCPGGARPAELMAALRSYQIRHYAVPGWLGRAVSVPGGLPLIVAIPVLLVLIGLAMIGGLVAPIGPVVYANLISFATMEILANALVGLSWIGLAVGLVRFWRGMDRHHADLFGGPAASASRWRFRDGIASAAALLMEILAHRRFRQCGPARSRAWEHAAVLYGFCLLFAASLGRMLYYYASGSAAGVAWTDPVKVLGNLGGLLLLAGLAGIAVNRLRQRPGYGSSAYSDWFLLAALALATLSGIATQVARFTPGGMVAYVTYLAHLVSVFVLLVYLPYSKFAHLFYRFAAQLHARKVGRTGSAADGDSAGAGTGAHSAASAGADQLRAG